MPDITMCSNDKCPLKNKCYRFLATPDYWQSYLEFKLNNDGECDDFWEVGEEDV